MNQQKMTNDQLRARWLEVVRQYCAGRRMVSTVDILKEVMGWTWAERDKGAQMLVAEILRSLGWQRRIVFVKGKAARRFLAPGEIIGCSAQASRCSAEELAGWSSRL